MLREFKQVTAELNSVESDLTDEKAQQILEMIFSANRIFLSGEGRSGLMVKAFANRLTQMGLLVHVVTEITAPAITKNDLLIFNSASGSSSFLIAQSKSARKQKAKILTFTAATDSALSKNSDLVVRINTQSKDQIGNSVQPMGSLFEQTSLLLFDCLSLKALNEHIVTSTSLRSTHSNLE
ncbi:SIS domain-containing protein [Lactobacillus sp. ESL0791]|uniref:6-phospho-3-hexuloisomerase n=1 Tax=Lactobacillus sp. ESL0791 TaxID=2983234 RepID=UPI0023F8AF5D|nr:6-phospho-3-hexuloisomerase [Lactobacillus sp. ESL0791]MDF7639566.1 SIS domain-containing protein [Lactobacillus sp. ESL0791]